MPAWVPEQIARWAPQFEEAAELHGVDPALLSIMTLVESNGNPDATSSLGAVGLMQILPATAESIARKRGIANFHLDDLRDPAINIDFGAWYLADQIATFGDGELSNRTVELAAAAYNGGPALLREHLDRGLPLTEESRRYSGLVAALWKEREQSRSVAYERLAATSSRSPTTP
jgi:soluble lytic murein transglycosylase-like protein